MTEYHIRGATSRHSKAPRNCETCGSKIQVGELYTETRAVIRPGRRLPNYHAPLRECRACRPPLFQFNIVPQEAA